MEELPKWIKPAYVWLCELTEGKPRRGKVIVHKDARKRLECEQPIVFSGMQMRLTGWYGEHRRVQKHLRNSIAGGGRESRLDLRIRGPLASRSPGALCKRPSEHDRVPLRTPQRSHTSRWTANSAASAIDAPARLHSPTIRAFSAFG